MFPLILAVLHRDCHKGVLESLLGTVSTRAQSKTLLGPGVGTCFLVFRVRGFPYNPLEARKGTLLFLGYSRV